MNEPELEQVIGCWKLVSYEFRDPEGELLPISPWGDDPVGTIIMDDKNHFSAQIMRKNRPEFDSDSPSSEVMKFAYAGYMAYFGTFEVNADEGILINRVEGSLNPDWVGTEQIRHFEFSYGQLVLRTPPMDTGKTQMTGTLVWEKAG